MSSRTRSSGGFSLVEMLIVVAIIGALAAMVFPMLFKVKASAKRAECLSNMKQLGTALLAYSEKFNAWGPHTDNDNGASPYGWFDSLGGFIGDVKFSRVKQCPMWEGYETVTADQHSIKMNQRLCLFTLTWADVMADPYRPYPAGADPTTSTTSAYYFCPIGRTKDPSNTIVFFDGRMGSEATQTSGINGRVDALRHDGITNILFMNGGAQGFDAESAGIMDSSNGTWTTLGPFIWQPVKGKIGE